MRLTCQEITELLIDFLEETMPPDQRRVMERHLCGCEPCMYYLTSYQQTIQLTHQLPDEPMPPEFAERLLKAMEAIREEG